LDLHCIQQQVEYTLTPRFTATLLYATALFVFCIPAD